MTAALGSPMVTGVHAPLPSLTPGRPASVEIVNSTATEIELVGSADLVVPKVLPVRTLSVSSIDKFERCQEQWMRHYMLREREPASIAMVGGSAVGNTLAAYYQAKRLGEILDLKTADDRLLAELKSGFADAVAREGESPEKKSEGARRALKIYLEEIAPTIQPAATERKVTLRFPGAEWTVTGYPDLETVDDAVIDYKVGDKHVKPDIVRSSIQPTMYLLARSLEGRPARGGFFYHSGLTLGTLRTQRRWEIKEARRTERQLGLLQARIARVARMIAVAIETGDWSYGPNGWWCSERYCPSFGSCPAGGLR